MIEFKRGDILSEGAEALVNTVNCVGVMGRGVALQFKNVYPANFKAYAAACDRGEVVPGRMHVFETGNAMLPRYIINFPTKRHWRGKSRMEDIEAGLEALAAEVRARGIKSIALPPLGAGLGGLDWADVRPRIERALGGLDDVRVVVFEPGAAPDAAPNRSTQPPSMTPGRASLVALLDRYVRGLLDPFATLLEVHKLMYFLQLAGEPLNLEYKKGHYGPYAENLRHVLRRVEGHLVSGYRDGGDAPGKQLELVPGALEDARALLAGQPETTARLERVFELVDGFETPSGLELLATTHWVVAREGAAGREEVVSRVHAWNRGKRRFTERQVGIALDALERQGWIPEAAAAGASAR